MIKIVPEKQFYESVSLMGLGDAQTADRGKRSVANIEHPRGSQNKYSFAKYIYCSRALCDDRTRNINIHNRYAPHTVLCIVEATFEYKIL